MTLAIFSVKHAPWFVSAGTTDMLPETSYHINSILSELRGGYHRGVVGQDTSSMTRSLLFQGPYQNANYP